MDRQQEFLMKMKHILRMDEIITQETKRVNRFIENMNLMKSIGLPWTTTEQQQSKGISSSIKILDAEIQKKITFKEMIKIAVSLNENCHDARLFNDLQSLMRTVTRAKKEGLIQLSEWQ